MISQCPHCHKNINLSEAQQHKVEKALAGLTDGKTLKIGCPHCRKPIELTADGGTADAGVASPPAGVKAKAGGDKQNTSPAEPPHPPDVSWLANGEMSEKAVVSDIPMALILIKPGSLRDRVVKAFEDDNYMPVFMDSAAEAINEMRFTDYAAVVMHSGYEGVDLAASSFHAHMCGMSMNRRRHIYYVLIGPEYRTLYDLEALAYSANLVINDKDVQYIDTILTKGFRDYEELFGPYLKVLKEHGKR